MNFTRTSRWSATRISQAVRRGEMSAVEVLRAYAEQIERTETLVQAWAHLDLEGALEHARAVDRRVAQGEAVGPLAGVPVGIKDIFNTLDMPAQMGSSLWAGFTPGNDARVVHYLRQAGAIFPGKTATAEFAVHSPGATRNPRDLTRSPGTSSSGSAAAVAAGMVPLALSSQTAASTIRPASYCGIFGFKPSFGLLPRTGMLKTTDSLDTVGLMSNHLEDLAVFLEVVRVRGRNFPFSDPAVRELGQAPDRPWRLGLVRGPYWEVAEGSARAGLHAFANRLGGSEGVEVVEAELPSELLEAPRVHALIYQKCLSYYFKEECSQPARVSPRFLEMVEAGRRITLDQYRAALDQQNRMARLFDGLSSRYDAFFTLSAAGSAVPFGTVGEPPDSTLLWTLCGAPVLSAPALHCSDGLPVGVQLVSRRYSDLRLLRLAADLEAIGALPARSDSVERLEGRASVSLVG